MKYLATERERAGWFDVVLRKKKKGENKYLNGKEKHKKSNIESKSFQVSKCTWWNLPSKETEKATVAITWLKSLGLCTKPCPLKANQLDFSTDFSSKDFLTVTNVLISVRTFTEINHQLLFYILKMSGYWFEWVQTSNLICTKSNLPGGDSGLVVGKLQRQGRSL